MNRAFPGTDLKATPHINFKIHVWKKNYGSLFTMLSRSGIGWNDTTKTIEATDEAWDAYVKVDGNARLMRYKSWPFYNNWCEIFGRDRATGSGAEWFIEAMNYVLNETQHKENDVFDGLDKLFDGFDETTKDMFVGQPESTTSGKKNTSKKRKSTNSHDPIYDILCKFCESTDARLANIAKRIGHEHDISNARKEVFTVVENIEGMTLKKKLLVSKLLVKDIEDMELFFSLPEHTREEFA